jgi:hypothetical protein
MLFFKVKITKNSIEILNIALKLPKNLTNNPCTVLKNSVLGIFCYFDFFAKKKDLFGSKMAKNYQKCLKMAKIEL